MRKLSVLGAVLIAALAAPAVAQDKVKVGVFPVSSSLPFFVAQDRGFFKAQNIETEMVRLIGGPPNVSGLITNQIDASAILVTIEGMNANLKKPGVAMYISLNGQNAQYQMEQFVGEVKALDIPFTFHSLLSQFPSFRNSRQLPFALRC